MRITFEGHWISRLPGLLLGSLCLAALAGCGFSPVYGNKGGTPYAAQQMSAVEIGWIAERPGQIMRNLLIDRMTPRGIPGRPDYRLELTLQEQEFEVAVRLDTSATRANLRQIARFKLVDLRTGAELLETESQTLDGFDIQPTTKGAYATQVARENARERGLISLADKITRRIAVYFATVAPR